MIHKILFLLLFCFIIQQQTQAQRNNSQFHADSVFIYTDYKFPGTTAGIKHNFNYLDSINANKIKLSQDDVAKLSAILNGTKAIKLVQQKYGGKICYMEVYYNGNRIRYVTSTSTTMGILDNLDHMKRWKIKVPEETEQFRNLIKKYWR